jgi:hypothetical protein
LRSPTWWEWEWCSKEYWAGGNWGPTMTHNHNFFKCFILFISSNHHYFSGIILLWYFMVADDW